MSDDLGDPSGPPSEAQAQAQEQGISYNHPATRMFGCAVRPCPDEPNPNAVLLEWPHLEAACGLPKVIADKRRLMEAGLEFMGVLEGDMLRLFCLQAPLFMVTMGDSERPFVCAEINAVKATLFTRKLMGESLPYDKHHGIMLELAKIAARISPLGPNTTPAMQAVHAYYDNMRSKILSRAWGSYVAGTEPQ
jgi:hypothetical protein